MDKLQNIMEFSARTADEDLVRLGKAPECIGRLALDQAEVPRAEFGSVLFCRVHCSPVALDGIDCAGELRELHAHTAGARADG